jgi:hypothetical protein
MVPVIFYLRGFPLLIHCVKIKKFFIKDLLDGSREARFFGIGVIAYSYNE